jgi:hypothetical protein
MEPNLSFIAGIILIAQSLEPGVWSRESYTVRIPLINCSS